MSQIDPAVFPDNEPLDKGDLRGQLGLARDELTFLERLQLAPLAAGITSLEINAANAANYHMRIIRPLEPTIAVTVSIAPGITLPGFIFALQKGPSPLTGSFGAVTMLDDLGQLSDYHLVRERALAVVYREGADQYFTTGAWLGFAQGLPGHQSPPRYSTHHTLTLEDFDNGEIRLENAAAMNLTVPLHASVGIPVGSPLLVRRAGAGLVTLVPEGPAVTIHRNGDLTLPDQDVSYRLKKVGDNEWDA